MIEVEPSDERRHEPGPEPGWAEAWSFDFAAPDGSLGGYVDLWLHPRRGVAWYWTALVGPGRPLVTVVEHEAPLPRPGASLELRAEGLWADHTCETALEHWSLGNEAFAVGLAQPAEAYGRMLGDRVPLGLDLEWETDGRPVARAATGEAAAGETSGSGAYDVPCRVHGEVLVGTERIDFDGHGQRTHRWGAGDPWARGGCVASGRLDDGTRFRAAIDDIDDIEDEDIDDPADHGGPARPRHPAEPAHRATGFVQDASGGLVPVAPARSGERYGAEGLALSSRIELTEGLALAVRPIAFAPVAVGGDGDPRSRLARALCRFVADDGRTGHGWTGWNQPQRA